MKKTGQNLKEFLGTPAGAVVAFIVLFYVLTFAVYYFYSPGPEERRQADLAKQEAANLPHVTQAVQNSTINVTVGSDTQQPLIQ